MARRLPMPRPVSDDEIRRLRAQLVTVSALLDEAEERLREGLATDAPPAPAPPVPVPSAPAARRAPARAVPVPPPPDDRDARDGPTAAERLREHLSGARGLAIIGGAVLILGLAFLYVLASQRGILGPRDRTLTGALVSLALVGGGIALERRRENLVGALAATGAGIAGLFLSVVAATRIFDLIPAGVGLLLAGAVGVAAIALARAWDSEWVALFGITGALAAPVLVDAGITPGTIAFVLVLGAAAAWLWIDRGWRVLAATAGGLAGLYTLALIVAAGTADRADTGFGWNAFWQSVLGASLFWALLTAATLARHRRRPDLTLTVRLLIGGAGVAIGGAVAMFHAGDAGVPLLVVAAAHLALAGACRPARVPDAATLAVVLGGVALAAVLLATLSLLDGASRGAVLAVQGGALALAAGRLRQPRLGLAAALYLGIAVIAIGVEAAPLQGLIEFPPERLMNAAGTALDGGAAVGAMAAALLLAAGLCALAWATVRLEEEDADGARGGAGLLAAVGLLFAVATVIVDGALLASFGRGTFQAAHAGVSIVWGLAALAVLVVGLRRRSALARNAGLALLGVTLAKLVLYDLSQLTSFGRAVAFVVVGVLFVTGSIAYQRMAADDREPGQG